MKILFLDVDGVINSRRTAYAYGRYPHEPIDEAFDYVALRLIRKLCTVGDIKIILSSSWRVDGNIGLMAQSWDLPIIGKTPIMGRRSDEVASWLCGADAASVTHYAIIDDDDDGLREKFPLAFVQTDREDGFLLSHYRQLGDILQVSRRNL